MRSILFLIPALALSQSIHITPGDPVVNEGGTVTITADRPVHFALAGAGSISSATGTSTTFTAPASVVAQHTLNGCMVLPSDSVYNTRIDTLPVDSNSVSWVPYISSIGVWMDYSWGTNVVTNALQATPQTFLYTSQYNGTDFPIPALPDKKREGGAYALDGSSDHHMLVINRQSCQFYETYQDGDPITSCPACTAVSGWTYSSTSYQQPVDPAQGGGTTDAAGLPLAPLTVHLSEIKAGVIKHALRFTTCLGCIGRSTRWPAVGSTGAQPSAPPMGARFRLKQSFDISGFPATTQVVLTALKDYGMFLADVGSEGHITASSDVTEDPQVVADLSAMNWRVDASNFEVVDESSFVLSTNSNEVNPSNPYQKPANYALLTVYDLSNPASVVSLPIAIQPVMVGTPSPTLAVQAGTPAFQIPHWVNGTSNSAVDWTITPSIDAGTITPDGIYAAPASVSSVTTAIVTGTSVVDPNASTSVEVTIIPAGVIRIDTGSQTSSTDESGNSWLPDLGFETGNHAVIDDNYPVNAWGQIPSVSVWQSYLYTYGDDLVYRFHVPNGNYRIELMYGVGECSGTYNTSSPNDGLFDGPVNLEIQSRIAAADFDFGVATGHSCRTPSTEYIDAKVTDTNLVIASRAIANSNGHSNPLLNGLVISPEVSKHPIWIQLPQLPPIAAGGPRVRK